MSRVDRGRVCGHILVPLRRFRKHLNTLYNISIRSVIQLTCPGAGLRRRAEGGTGPVDQDKSNTKKRTKSA